MNAHRPDVVRTHEQDLLARWNSVLSRGTNQDLTRQSQIGPRKDPFLNPNLDRRV